ncbi:MAG: beta-sandwich domain-containing protein [Bdellovibrio sp.]|nr:beta-sandwich domain-containing protein [Bdellovibrio sp.]
MERQWAHKIMASILLVAPGIVHAEANYPIYYTGTVDAQAPATQPPQSPQVPYEGTGRIGDITRKNGGALYKLDLAKAVPLTSLKAKSKMGKVKIVGVTLITDKNDRIPVKAFSNIVLADNGAAIPSENFTSTANISVIEIQAEAMGGNAALEINASSVAEIPQLTLREETSCSKKFDAILKDKLDTVQLWAGRAESAQAGTWQEKYASKEFTKYVADFIATIKSGNNNFASTEYTLTLLNFFAERHNASRPDSAADQGYKAMATETFDVFLSSFQSDQTCRIVTAENLIDIAIDFQKKQEASKQDSRARKIYEMMVSKLGKFVPTQYRKELATKNLTFRQADTEGNKYFKLFAGSKPESFLKATYQDMSTNAYGVAEQALNKEVKDLDSEQTYQLIVEFQAKYNDPTNYPQDMMAKYLAILSEHSIFLKKQLQ